MRRDNPTHLGDQDADDDEQRALAEYEPEHPLMTRPKRQADSKFAVTTHDRSRDHPEP
jgi:hypothetical protein